MFCAQTKYCILFITTFCFTTLLHAQRQKLQYDISADKFWIDSVNIIVKKGFEENTEKKNNYLTQLKYFNSCIALGRYYETLYNKGTLTSNRKAIFYYEKVTDYGRFPDDERYFKGLAVRNTLCRKLASIYFFGKGIKKNRNESLALALKGTSGCSGFFFNTYSKRYFGSTSIVFKSRHKPDYNTDTLFTFTTINPFALQSYLFNARVIDKYLDKIAASYNKRFRLDTTCNILITAFAETSSRSQLYSNRICDNIRNYLQSKKFIKPDRIISNVTIEDMEVRVKGPVEISFTKTY